ncbi:MAG: ATP-binding protein [Proteobacteria bacterium]|nr:ATP-binding protein [Pseudomonadota bacterium]
MSFREVSDNETLFWLLGDRVQRVLDEHGVRVRIELDWPEFSDQADVLSALRADLAKLHDGQVELNRLAAIGELAAGTIHETRNIVATICGLAQVAGRKHADPRTLDELIATIRQESARCAEVTGNYLELARKGDSAHQTIEVNDLVHVAARIVRHSLGMHGIRTAVDLAPILPDIFGDRNRLLQVLINLSRNAQQALSDGGLVTFSTAEQNGNAIITVTDDGPGVPGDLHQRIFEPFFTTKAAGTGSGLGLAISARIVSEHGGKLSVEDASPHGARFVLCLPPDPQDG